ncbi:sensor histidine kinase [Desulfosporosinus acidiphilus]|uniref:sensor histidine kinase n=1 Tax=Desulfosporosinus acidiphilus TaxID=885581 RepID=UPI001FA6FCB0|nr:ATP-binding protein [Desulfosporosinus acidiphilus]
MLGVFLVSVVIQAREIRTVSYDQQARFFIYEAEEVVTIYNDRQSTNDSSLKERLGILSNFLNADILIIDAGGNKVYEGNSCEIQSSLFGQSAFKNKVLSGNNVVFAGRVNGYNQDVFLAAVPMIKDGKVAGAVAICSPLTAISQHINSMLLITLSGALLGIALATIISVFISRKLVRPLVKMEENAKLIASGEFRREIPVESEDEVGRLASSFNSMSKQLDQKIQAIEQLSKQRQALLSDVSHELRTPLTVIKGYSEAVLDGLVRSKEQQELYLQNISDESARLKRLVDDWLDLQTMDTDKAFDNMEYVVLNKLVLVSVERFKHLAENKGVRIDTCVPEDTITISGNIDRLKQVLTNLLDNAVNHSNGKVIVELGLESAQAYITIKDDGPGIPPSELDNIWDRFYKVDKSRSRRGTGTGLGLSIVKQIVEKHGGKVTADSRLGLGSIFTVYLPSGELAGF